jgi:ABC-type multidrug transport system fused ATPase/permease subunit
MKKLFSTILLLGLLLSGNAYAETINQRLDAIEKRLEKIEESLSGIEMINNLLNTNILGNSPKSKNITKTNKSKLDLKLKQLNCFDDTIGIEKIFIRYQITNNYEKKIKLVDATLIANDLLGEVIFRGQIARDVYLASGGVDNVEVSYSDLMMNKCGRIKSVEFSDIKYVLNVSKIAFEDNTVLEFN